MRLLHVSDVHLGAAAHSRPGPDGVPTALESTTRCWLRACEIAIQENVELVLVAGDVFHQRHPDALALNAFEAGLRLLYFADIRVVIVDGNHDGSKTPALPSVLAVFGERTWDGTAAVTVSSKPEIVDAVGLRIGTLPWVSRQYLAAQHDGITRAEASTAVIDGLQRILDGYRAEAVDVVMGHWTVEGAQLQGSEIDVSITGEAVLPLPALEGFRYVAMGHIHRAQTLRPPSMGAYSGSIDRLSFGEEGEPKGVYLVDVGERGCDLRFLETPARRFVTIDFGAEDLDQIDVEDAIVRVRNVPSSVAAQVQVVTVQSGAVTCYVEPEIERTEIRRAEDVTEAMGPLEATDRVLELWGVDEVKRPVIRAAVKEVVEA